MPALVVPNGSTASERAEFDYRRRSSFTSIYTYTFAGGRYRRLRSNHKHVPQALNSLGRACENNVYDKHRMKQNESVWVVFIVRFRFYEYVRVYTRRVRTVVKKKK